MVGRRCAKTVQWKPKVHRRQLGRSHEMHLPTISTHSSPHSNPNNHFTLSPTSFFGTRITLLRASSSSRSLLNTNCHATSATVSFSLPTPKPLSDTPEKTPKWSARAIKSYAMGELEARKLKNPNTGIEALLIGNLVEVIAMTTSPSIAN
ncbi:ATP-dependent Clp protease ATP-binding subunit CLPT1, chloroplastic [Glycine soja]